MKVTGENEEIPTVSSQQGKFEKKRQAAIERRAKKAKEKAEFLANSTGTVFTDNDGNTKFTNHYHIDPITGLKFR